VALTILVVGCFVVLRPFLVALLWSLLLTVATWPAFERLKHGLGGRRTIAAALMTLMLALVLLVPFVLAGRGLAENLRTLTQFVVSTLQLPAPAPPGWLGEVPVIGDDAVSAWRSLLDADRTLGAILSPYIGTATRWTLSTAANLGTDLLQLAISVVIAFFLYRDGEAAARRMRTFFDRVAGDRAERLLRVAHGTMTGVIYGILGTALAQGGLAAIGLAIAGVPAALLLGFVTAFLSLIPGGPALVMWPAAFWLFNEGQIGWAVFVFLWGIFPVGTVDNIIKPLFISRGSTLPLILVFLGVIGGALSFGLLGIFIGPVLLAMAYTLLREWTARAPLTQPQAPEAPREAAE
jgi:predicted PurR-regulated permease PerM